MRQCKIPLERLWKKIALFGSDISVDHDLHEL